MAEPGFAWFNSAFERTPANITLVIAPEAWKVSPHMTVDPRTKPVRCKGSETQTWAAVAGSGFESGSMPIRLRVAPGHSAASSGMLRQALTASRQSGAASMRTIFTIALIFAIILIETLIGGTRLLFSVPSYTLIAFIALASIFVRPDRELRPSRACLGVTVVFFTYILLRAALSPVQYLWWMDFYMVLGCLMVYFLTVFYITDPRRRAMIIWALLAFAVVEVLLGLRQFSVGDNWMPFGFLRADTGRRASGTLISSIHLAGYLEAVAAFGLSYALWSTWKPAARIIAGYVAVMSYVGVAITGSRGGYISTLFSLLIFVAISLYTVRKTRPHKFPLIAGISVVLIAVSLAGAVGVMSQSELLRGRLSGISKQFEKNGLDIRIYNWQAALDQYRVNPVFGTGAGTHIYYGRLFRRIQLQADPIHAHSDYLELLAEYGIVGSVGMAAFLLVHLGVGWRSYRAVLKKDLNEVSDWEPARNDSMALYIGALTAISSYIAHSVVDFNLHIPGHALIFAFIFGVLASPVYGLPARKRASSALLLRWSLPLLGAGMIFGGLSKFPGEYWTERARAGVRDFEFDEAIGYAQTAISLEQNNPELYFHLGDAHRGAALISEDQQTRVDHLVKAVDAYQKSLEIFPSDVHTLVRLAQALEGLGLFKRAETILLSALQMDPNLGRAHAYYARHLAIVGRQEEAEARLKIAMERAYNDNVSHILRGSPLDPQFDAQ